MYSLHTPHSLSVSLSLSLLRSLFVSLCLKKNKKKSLFYPVCWICISIQFNSVVVLNCVGKCSGIKFFLIAYFFGKNTIHGVLWMDLAQLFSMKQKASTVPPTPIACHYSWKLIDTILSRTHTQTQTKATTKKTQIFAFVCAFFLFVLMLLKYVVLLLSWLKNFNKSRRWKMSSRLAIEND